MPPTDFYDYVDPTGRGSVTITDTHKSLQTYMPDAPSLDCLQAAVQNVCGGIRPITRSAFRAVLQEADRLKCLQREWRWDWRILCENSTGRMPVPEAKAFAARFATAGFTPAAWDVFVGRRLSPAAPVAYEEVEGYLFKIFAVSSGETNRETLEAIQLESAAARQAEIRALYSLHMDSEQDAVRKQTEAVQAAALARMSAQLHAQRQMELARRLYPDVCITPALDRRRLQHAALMLAQRAALAAVGHAVELLDNDIIVARNLDLEYIPPTGLRDLAARDLELLRVANLEARATAVAGKTKDLAEKDSAAAIAELRAILSEDAPSIPFADTKEELTALMAIRVQKAMAGTLLPTPGQTGLTAPVIAALVAEFEQLDAAFVKEQATLLAILDGLLDDDADDILVRQRRLNAASGADISTEAAILLIDAVIVARIAADKPHDECEFLKDSLQDGSMTPAELPPHVQQAAVEYATVAQATPARGVLHSSPDITALFQHLTELRQRHPVAPAAGGVAPAPRPVADAYAPLTAEQRDAARHAAIARALAVSDTAFVDLAQVLRGSPGKGPRASAALDALDVPADESFASVASFKSGMSETQDEVANITDGVNALQDSIAAQLSLQAEALAKQRPRTARVLSPEDATELTAQLVQQANAVEQSLQRGLNKQEAVLRARLQQRKMAKQSASDDRVHASAIMTQFTRTQSNMEATTARSKETIVGQVQQRVQARKAVKAVAVPQ
eukprot:m.89677 g.89677  ORF g.89677 m.89677 type:complete len:735 (-) comp8424_c0_seq2:185-2389(-)